jgi:hypothetical protein
MFPHQNPVFISLLPQNCPNLNPCMTFSVCTDCEADCCTAANQGNYSDVFHGLTRDVVFVSSLFKGQQNNLPYFVNCKLHQDFRRQI